MAKKTRIGGRRTPIRVKKRKAVLIEEVPEAQKVRIAKRRSRSIQRRRAVERLRKAPARRRRRNERITGKERPKFTTVVTKVISPRGRQLLPLSDIRGAPAPGQPQTAQNIVLESTAIAGFRYDPEKKILEITFVSGAVYWYHGVDLLTVEKLASPFTKSKGRYFVNNIRNSFGTPTRIR